MVVVRTLGVVLVLVAALGAGCLAGRSKRPQVGDAVVGRYITFLKDDRDWKVRAGAAKALGNLGADEALPALTHALGDEDPRVRLESGLAMIAIDEDEAPIVVLVLSEIVADKRADSKTRTRAANELRLLGPKAIDAVMPLHASLQDRQLNVRVAAGRALAAIGALKPDDIALLSWMYAEALAAVVPSNKTDMDAALEAMVGLDELLRDYEYTQAVFESFLVSGDPFMQVVGAKYLAARDERYHEHLLQAAQRGLGVYNVMGRILSVEALSDLGEGACPAAGELARALGDSEPQVRDAAAAALVSAGECAMDPLTKALRRPAPAVQARAARALYAIEGDPEVVVPVLNYVLSSSDNEARCQAIETLVRIGPDAKQALPRLINLLSLRQSYCWAALVTAVGRVGEDAAVPALVELLTDPRVEVRRSAVSALAEMGAEAAIAQVPLAELLNDEDRRTRELAAKALETIKGEQ